MYRSFNLVGWRTSANNLSLDVYYFVIIIIIIIVIIIIAIIIIIIVAVVVEHGFMDLTW